MVEVDGLAELAHHLRAQRIDAHEQALDELAVGQRVAACVPLEPFVGAHDHHRRLLPGSRLGIPCDAKRRLEREGVAPRLDSGDPHQSPP